MVACSYPNSSFFSSNNTCTVHLRIPYTYHSPQGFSNPTVLDPSDSRHLVTIQGNGIQTIFTTHLVTRMRLTMWIVLTNQVTGWWFQTLLRFISIHANVGKNTTLIPAWMFWVFFQKATTPELMLQHLLQYSPFQASMILKVEDISSTETPWSRSDFRQAHPTSSQSSSVEHTTVLQKGLCLSGGCQFLESKYICHEAMLLVEPKTGSRKKKRFQNS